MGEVKLENNNGRKLNLSFVSSIAGLISSAVILPFGVWVVVSIFTLQERQAVLTNQVLNATTRLGALESNGSMEFQAHKVFDTERVDNLKVRVSNVESAIVLLTNVKEQLAVINTRLQSLYDSSKFQQDQLNALTKQTKP